MQWREMARVALVLVLVTVATVACLVLPQPYVGAALAVALVLGASIAWPHRPRRGHTR